jgi:hypothetical protein
MRQPRRNRRPVEKPLFRLLKKIQRRGALWVFRVSVPAFRVELETRNSELELCKRIGVFFSSLPGLIVNSYLLW